MIYSLWRRREKILLTILLLVLIIIVTNSDWRDAIWEWSGTNNENETNSSTIRNIGLIVLSAVAIILTWKRIKVAEHQARTSARSLTTTRDALDLNYKTLDYTAQKDEQAHNDYRDEREYSENRDKTEFLYHQYHKALEALNSSSVSARLGAVYELQHLTGEDPDLFHVRTMKVLCAFVRHPPTDPNIPIPDKADPCRSALRSDVQAAIEVIGSRTEQHLELESVAMYTPDLRKSYLVRAELRNANLSNVDMRGSILWGADLMFVSFSNSELQYTDFSSPWVIRNEQRINITKEKGSVVEVGNRFFESMTRMLVADLSGAKLLCANLSGVYLQGGDLSDANLPDTDLSDAYLLGVNLSRSHLGEANLSRAILCSANLSDTNFYNTNLTGTDLSGDYGENYTTKHPPQGLTQAQLDQACADPADPPQLDDESEMVWRGGSCRESPNE